MIDEPKKEEELLDEPTTSGLEEELATCEKQRDEYLSGWQRAKADLLNYKKEELKRFEDIARYGNEELMRELIDVLDNFDLGIAALEKAGPVEKGIYLIRSQIESLLKRRGLERIEAKPGDVFDPAIAEAIGEIEADGPPGHVVIQIAPGYKLYDKIIRPARVQVSKAKGQPQT